MINKIWQLGKYVNSSEAKNNPLNLKTNVIGAYVIILQFYYDDKKCEYKGIDVIQEYTRDNMDKFMFIDLPPNSTPFFPSWSIGENPSTSLNKLKKSFKEKCNLEAFSETIKANEKMILDDIKQSLDKNASNHVLTVNINGKLIMDSELFAETISNYKENIDKTHFYMETGKVTSKGVTHCYLCKNKKIVYGFVNLNDFTFYSANEQAYIASGFVKSKTWKNYPVCPDCIPYLQSGKYLVETYFSHKFWGNDYFILPTPILERNDFKTFVENMKEEYHQISLRRGDDYKSQQSKELEEEIFNCLAKQNDIATITFFFYEKEQNKFQIMQEAEDILPSRFQNIITAKKKVEEYKEFHNLNGLYKKGEVANLSFNFGIIKTFFPSNFNNDFLDITTKILKGQKISRTLLFHQISDHLAKGFRNEALYHDIEKAMILMEFLSELKLVEITTGKLEIKMDNKYQDYFDQHPEFYNADWKKAVFLTGVLAQHVMDIQYRERKATPFRSRLNGLKLDPRAIKRLLPESIEKLDQYRSNYYRDLEEVIAQLLESGEPELKLQSIDEISFLFAVGMNRNKQFKSKNETEGEDNE